MLTTIYLPFLLQVHICMSKGDSFPSIHGQLDVKGLGFQILDAPSSFSVRLCVTSSSFPSILRICNNQGLARNHFSKA